MRKKQILKINPIGLARIKAGFERKDAAKKLGVTIQFLGQIEKKEATKFPSYKTQVKMCELYNCSLDELMKGGKRRETNVV